LNMERLTAVENAKQSNPTGYIDFVIQYRGMNFRPGMRHTIIPSLSLAYDEQPRSNQSDESYDADQ